MRLLLLLLLLTPNFTLAEQMTWSTIESRIMNANLDVQTQSSELSAAKRESNAISSTFFPTISLNAGSGRETKLKEDNRGTQLYVEGKWNLYRGGRDAALKEKSQIAVELEQNRLEIAKRNTLFRARELFTSILSRKKWLAVLDDEQHLNDQQRGMAQKKVRAGLTSSVDEIEFDLRNDLILAEKHKLEAEQERQLAELRAILNHPANNLEIVGDFTTPEKRELSTSDLLQGPLNAKAALDLKLSNAEHSIIRSAFLPEVNLIGAYGRQTLQHDAVDKNDETTATLSVSLPLFSGFETTNLSRAQVERIAAREIQLHQTQNNLYVSLNNLQSRWKETWSLLDLNQKTLDRTKKYYDLTLGEYRRGVKNSPDLVSATERLFNAEVESIKLTKELILIQADFERTFNKD